MPKHPNILIFCTDEQRGDHLSCMGHPDVKTPNIDRLAAEGTLFKNCYSSCPICMPARATMFTGQTNRVNGMPDNGFNLRKDLPTLPGVLANAGYRTHAVGKLHLAGAGGREIAADEDFSEYPERRIYWDWPGHWEGAFYKHFPDNYYGLQTVELAQGHVHYIYGEYVTWLEENHPGAYAGYTCNNADPHPLTIDADLHYNTWIADRSIEFITQMAMGKGRVAGGEEEEIPKHPNIQTPKYPSTQGPREIRNPKSEIKTQDISDQSRITTVRRTVPALPELERSGNHESRINQAAPGSVAGAAPGSVAGAAPGSVAGAAPGSVA
ncbi:MAG: sulfatase-like hydrolase/transferase, partial [Lentisphaeria bacterium]|nr:sulfatase-like hydrolase/transferase [Lentisphaeria bacterium]